MTKKDLPDASSRFSRCTWPFYSESITHVEYIILDTRGLWTGC